MKSSLTCHERPFLSSRFLQLMCASALAAHSARAVDPNRAMSQYVRQHWGTESGFPRGPVYSIAQSKDGYLWIGTEKGLVRFDGLEFQVVESTAPGGPVLNHVLGLFADDEGNLWVRMRRSAQTLLRYQNQKFTDFMDILGRSRTSVSAMGRARDGSLLLWVLEGEPSALVLRGRQFETIASPQNFSRSPVLAVAQTQDGDVWVGTRDAGLFRLSGGRTIAIRQGLPDLKVNSLVAFGRNELWVGTDAGVVRWDGEKLTRSGLPAALESVQALTLAMDRDTNLWIGTNSRGLLRVTAHSVETLASGSPSNDAVTAVFEDREGNMWVGSGSGLDRLRDSPFVTFSRPEGVPSDGSTPIFVDTEDRTWFAPVSGGLWWMTEKRSGQISGSGIENDVIYSIAGGRKGLWLGRQRGGLTQLELRQGTVIPKTFTEADGLPQDSVYSVYEGVDGTVWAGTLSGGVSRLREGKFTNYSSADGLASNAVYAILQTADSTMWFGTSGGLSSLAGDRWQSFTAKTGLPSDEVNCLLQDSAGTLWAGTSAGLAFQKAGRFQAVSGGPVSLRESILGLVEDRFGSLWITTANHVLGVRRDKLMQGKLADGDVNDYGIADGLRGVEGVKRSRSAVADSAGRIWLSLNRGISLIDPARLRSFSKDAIPHVESLRADGTPIRLGGAVHIPGGRQRVTLSYAGLSLSVPERVRFRFRLDGFDRAWSEPSTAHEAVYTNLGPGAYKFRVIASNPEGQWSASEASVGFQVDPLLWQTWWFRTTAVLACALAGWAWYRLRMHQVTRGLNVRFEERLAERTRIAQELHDTLLQGFLSASMQVHVASDRVPEDSNAKPILTRALQLMSQVIEEGRNAVRGLRSTHSASLDLEQAFSRVQEEVSSGSDGGTGFRVVVEGQARPLHPVLRDEIYRIGREALINAFRHSQAKSIELELQYSRGALLLLVRDDGCGIDPEILGAGREGHWGLSGMRERADRIGAKFRVRSRSGAGTEVELSVPSHVAFQDHRKQPKGAMP